MRHQRKTVGAVWRVCIGRGLMGVLCLVLFSFSCKKSSEDLCDSACRHATEVVLGIVAEQGALNSQALQDRSVEMNKSCIVECLEGGIKPDCLLKASTYDALQECSTEAPEEEPKEEPKDDSAKELAVPGTETQPAETGSEKLQDGVAPREPSQSTTQGDSSESPSGP